MTDRSDHSRATWRQSLQGWLWVAPALLFLVIFVYGPALTNIRFSMFSFSAMSLDWDFVGFDNYLRLWNDPKFMTALTNNAIYAVISVSCQVGIALVLAAVLEARIFPDFSANLFRTALFLPQIIPGAAAAIAWVWMLSIDGVVNQLLGLVGLDSMGNCHWLQLEPGSGLNDLAELARSAGLGFDTVRAIQNGSQPWGHTPPGFGALIIGNNGIETKTTQLLLSAEKPYTKESGWGFTAAYTFSHAKGNRGGDEHYSFDAPTIDAYPFIDLKAVPRHRLVMTGIYDLPWGFTASAKVTLATPPPTGPVCPRPM